MASPVVQAAAAAASASPVDRPPPEDISLEDAKKFREWFAATDTQIKNVGIDTLNPVELQGPIAELFDTLENGGKGQDLLRIWHNDLPTVDQSNMQQVWNFIGDFISKMPSTQAVEFPTTEEARKALYVQAMEVLKGIPQVDELKAKLTELYEKIEECCEDGAALPPPGGRPGTAQPTPPPPGGRPAAVQQQPQAAPAVALATGGLPAAAQQQPQAAPAVALATGGLPVVGGLPAAAQQQPQAALPSGATSRGNLQGAIAATMAARAAQQQPQAAPLVVAGGEAPQQPQAAPLVAAGGEAPQQPQAAPLVVAGGEAPQQPQAAPLVVAGGGAAAGQESEQDRLARELWEAEQDRAREAAAKGSPGAALTDARALGGYRYPIGRGRRPSTAEPPALSSAAEPPALPTAEPAPALPPAALAPAQLPAEPVVAAKSPEQEREEQEAEAAMEAKIKAAITTLGNGGFDIGLEQTIEDAFIDWHAARQILQEINDQLPRLSPGESAEALRLKEQLKDTQKEILENVAQKRWTAPLGTDGKEDILGKAVGMSDLKGTVLGMLQEEMEFLRLLEGERYSIAEREALAATQARLQEEQRVRDEAERVVKAAAESERRIAVPELNAFRSAEDPFFKNASILSPENTLERRKVRQEARMPAASLATITPKEMKEFLDNLRNTVFYLFKNNNNETINKAAKQGITQAAAEGIVRAEGVFLVGNKEIGAAFKAYLVAYLTSTYPDQIGIKMDATIPERAVAIVKKNPKAATAFDTAFQRAMNGTTFNQRYKNDFVELWNRMQEASKGIVPLPQLAAAPVAAAPVAPATYEPPPPPEVGEITEWTENPIRKQILSRLPEDTSAAPVGTKDVDAYKGEIKAIQTKPLGEQSSLVTNVSSAILHDAFDEQLLFSMLNPMLKNAGVASKLVKDLGTETTSDTPKLVRALKKFAEEAKTSAKDLEALKKAAKDTIPASLQELDQQRSDLVKSVLDAATPALERFMERTRARKASIAALLADPTQLPPPETPFTLDNPIRLEFRSKTYESTVPAKPPAIGLRDSEQTFANVPFTFSNPMFTQAAKDVTLTKLSYVPPQVVADTLQAIGIEGKPPTTPEESKRLTSLVEDQVTEETLGSYELSQEQRVQLQTALEALKRGGSQALPPVLADEALQARFDALRKSLLGRQRAWQKKEEDPPIDITVNPMFAQVGQVIKAKKGGEPLTPNDKLALYSLYRRGAYPTANTLEKVADSAIQTAQEVEQITEASPAEKRPQVKRTLTSVLKGDAISAADPTFSVVNPFLESQKAKVKAVRTEAPVPRLDVTTLDFSGVNPMQAAEAGGAAAAVSVRPELLGSLAAGFGPTAGEAAVAAAEKRQEEVKKAAIAGAGEGNTVSPMLTGRKASPAGGAPGVPGLLASFGPKGAEIAAAAASKAAEEAAKGTEEARKAALAQAVAPPPATGLKGLTLGGLFKKLQGNNRTRKNAKGPKTMENIEREQAEAAEKKLSASLVTPSGLTAVQAARASGRASGPKLPLGRGRAAVPVNPEGSFGVTNPLRPSLPGQPERKQRGGRKTLKQKKSRKSMRKMSNA